VAGYQTVAQRNLTCAIRIRERRRELGLTQAEVVDRVERHGSRLSNQALSAIENGRRLAVGRLPDLAAALDCTVTYLIGLTTDPRRWTPDEPDELRAHPAARPATPEPRGTPEPGAQPAPSADAQDKPQPEPAPSTAPRPEPALSASSRSSRSSRSSHAQDIHRTSSRRPAPSPVTPPHRNWILGPDVPDTSGELRARAHEADPAPTPRRPR
jgi:transcriptional regulator with XRE-family HTH domain